MTDTSDWLRLVMTCNRHFRHQRGVYYSPSAAHRICLLCAITCFLWSQYSTGSRQLTDSHSNCNDNDSENCSIFFKIPQPITPRHWVIRSWRRYSESTVLGMCNLWSIPLSRGGKWAKGKPNTSFSTLWYSTRESSYKPIQYRYWYYNFLLNLADIAMYILYCKIRLL